MPGQAFGHLPLSLHKNPVSALVAKRILRQHRDREWAATVRAPLEAGCMISHYPGRTSSHTDQDVRRCILAVGPVAQRRAPTGFVRPSDAPCPIPPRHLQQSILLRSNAQGLTVATRKQNKMLIAGDKAISQQAELKSAMRPGAISPLAASLPRR
jgi:hypothetical protein